MKTLKTVQDELETRTYAVLDIHGEEQLMVKLDGEWSQDATCVSINQMVRAGLISFT